MKIKAPIVFQIVPQDKGYNVSVSNPNAGTGRALSLAATDLDAVKKLIHAEVDALDDSEPQGAASV